MKELTRIRKKIFLSARLCPRQAWFLYHETASPVLTLGEQFRIEQGIEIGEKARELFPEGILIEQKAAEDAARKTRELLADPSINIIFEAAFLHNDYAARADVLVRNGDAWDLIEVKSKTVKTLDKKKDRGDLIDDIAYTATIIGKNGLCVSSARLMLLSDTFRRGMDPEKLFGSHDCTHEVRERVKEFEKVLDDDAAIISGPEKPAFRLIGECKKCGYFEQCVPKRTECTIFDIPRVTEKQLQDLYGRGIILARDIPAGFRLTDTQTGPVACMRSGKTVIDPGLGKELAKIRWPAHYLDFETTQTAYPLYADVSPYEKIPIQYSIHTCSECGKVLHHREYLADPGKDCRKELAEKLLADLDGNGSILCYSSFERQIIEGLAKTYPGLREPLTALVGRLIDLINCSKCVNHPEFRGSNSIKVVLPVLVPGMTYEGLPIANGEDALVTFAYMAMGKISGEECTQKREEMLRYCEQDTLAMVKIHEDFEKMAERF